MKENIRKMMVLVLFICGFSTSVHAASLSDEAELMVNTEVSVSLSRGTCGEELFWGLSDKGVLTIYGSGDMDDYNQVSEVPWYSCASQVTTVVVENGVTSIGKYAFSECNSLMEVSIPDSVTVIGSAAFSGCISLEEVVLPNSITSMGSYVFGNCTALKNVVLPEGILTVGGFVNCSSLNDVEIPKGVTSILPHAFKGCTALHKIDIPESVDSIGLGAFQGCMSLENMEIPYGVTKIDSAAFQGCSSLIQITIAESVTEIGISAFEGCTELKDVRIPDSVTAVGNEAFDNCTSLETVILSENMEHVSGFKNCGQLTQIILPDGISVIGDEAFSGCTGLKHIEIPDSVREIGAYAFYGCSGLETMIFPERISKIGARALAGCVNLRQVLFLGNLPDTELYTFYGLYATCYYPVKDEKWVAFLEAGYDICEKSNEEKDEIGEEIQRTWSWETYETLPIILEQPVTQKVEVGAKTIFAVTSLGEKLGYQWQYRNSSGIWKDSTLTGNKTKTFSVKATTERNGYQYRCKITDAGGNVIYTDTAYLYVLGIKKQPVSVMTEEGETVKYTVTATGYGKKYQWQYRNSSGIWKDSTLTGNKTKTFSVKATTGRNGYQYRCKITDAGGNTVYTNEVKLILVQ